MKKYCIFLLFFPLPFQVYDQQYDLGYYKADYNVTRTIKKGKYTLVFINKDSSFCEETSQQLIDLFFRVYPAEVKRFNPHPSTNVTFIIDPNYKGVAASLNSIVRLNPEWLDKNPEDIDAATHELMHVVQNYPEGAPGWLTEGIADYARYTFGINNERSGWKLPAYYAGQNYTDGYRITARFLLWAEDHYNSELVSQLNAALRNHKYSDPAWLKLTGKSIDELWYLYSLKPALP